MPNILFLTTNPQIFNEESEKSKRSLFFINALAKTCKVHVLAFGYKAEAEETEISKSIKLSVVPSEPSIVSAIDRRDSGLVSKRPELLTNVYSKYFRQFHAKLNTIANKNDIIVVDGYEAATFIYYLNNKDMPIFYNANACETVIAESAYPEGSKDIEIINSMERDAFDKCSGFSYKNEEDLNNIKKYFSFSSKAINIPENDSDLEDSYAKAVLDIFNGQPRSFMFDIAPGTKKEKVLVYSIIRNEVSHVDTYYKQLKQMVDSFPQYEFYLSIYENDSNDGTKERLFSKDWSFFSKVSIMSEKLMKKDYGSTKEEERVKNLSIARNKAITVSDWLDQSDYVMMVESDMQFNMNTVKKILTFKEKEPNFDVVSGITIRAKKLYDTWATRRQPAFKPDGHTNPDMDSNYKLKSYDKYYSTSNGICLYRAKPFKEGARYGWINNVTGEADCDTVIICQDFHDRGYKNVYIIHDAEIYHEHYA